MSITNKKLLGIFHHRMDVPTDENRLNIIVDSIRRLRHELAVFDAKEVPSSHSHTSHHYNPAGGVDINDVSSLQFRPLRAMTSLKGTKVVPVR